MFIKNTIALAVATSLLTGCGGGGEGDSAPTKPKKSAPIPMLTVSNMDVVEPSIEKNEEVFELKVGLSSKADKDVSFKYELLDGSAKSGEGDFIQSQGVVTIKKGTRAAVIPFTILADKIQEDREDFSIRLTELKNAKFASDSSVNITIKDNNYEVPELEIKDAKVIEPRSGSKEFQLRVSLANPAPQNITFKYESESGTASHRMFDQQYADGKVSDININSENLDYVRFMGDAVIEKGKKYFDIPFTVLADEVYEPAPETFIINFTNLKNAKFLKGVNSSTVSIQDSDKKPVVKLDDISDVLVAEGPSINIPVSVSSFVAKGVELHFKIDGIGVEGKDYEIVTPSPLLFGYPDDAKESNKQSFIKLNILKDRDFEGPEPLTLTLVDAVNGDIDPRANQKKIVIDSDRTLNDTGVKTYFRPSYSEKPSAEDYRSNYASSAYGENDADLGRDNLVGDNNTDGWASFSYDSIDGSGNVIAKGQNRIPVCIRDNVTGLLWERLEDAQSLHSDPELLSKKLSDSHQQILDEWAETQAGLHWRAKNYTYIWYNKDSSVNGGEPGKRLSTAKLKNAGNGNFSLNDMCSMPSDAISRKYLLPVPKDGYCTAQAKADYARNVTLCGNVNWRLPTINELINKHNYSAVNPVTVSDYPTIKNEIGENIDPFSTNMHIVNNGYIEPTIDQLDTIKGLIEPNPIDSNEANKWVSGEIFYLSSTTVASDTGAVWCFGALSGEVKKCKKQDANAVILVSDGKISR